MAADLTPGARRLASEATLLGRTVLHSRDDLIRSVAGPSGERLDVLAALHDRVAMQLADGVGADVVACRARTLELARSALRDYASSGATPCDVDVARIAVGLHDKRARDEVGTWALDEEREALLGLLADLSRRTHDEVCVPVCTALAWVAHSCGEGALANVAVDRALAALPDDSMALLVRQALDSQLHPDLLAVVNREVRRELGGASTAGPAHEAGEGSA